MLFYFYLISVVISIVVIHITTISFLERLKKDNICIREEHSFLEEAKALFFTFFYVVVPVYNIVHDIYLLCCNNRIYQKIITKLFLQGKADFDERFLEFIKE